MFHFFDLTKCLPKKNKICSLSDPLSAEVLRGKHDFLPGVCAQKQVCVFVCRTLWVVWALGEISEVPDTVCPQPPTPHISGHVVSQPPALNWKKRKDGHKYRQRNSQNLLTHCVLGWIYIYIYVSVCWGVCRHKEQRNAHPPATELCHEPRSRTHHSAKNVRYLHEDH